MLEIQKETLDQLTEVSRHLNQQTTDLNNSFYTIERKLCSMKLGVSGWANKLVGVKEEAGTGYKFGFCRVGKEGWKLVCRKVTLGLEELEDDRGKISYGLLEPITAMPRAIRLEASTLIDEVIKDLISRAQTFSNDVDIALDNLSDVDSQLDNTEATE